MATRKAARKRTLIEPTPGDKRYVRRDSGGKFKDVVDVGRSLAADRRSKSSKAVKPGQGDKGDVKRSPSKKSSAKKASAKKSSAKKSTASKKSSRSTASKKSTASKTSSKKSSAKKSSKKK